MKKLKAEKRQTIARKKIIKDKKVGTLAGQISRLQINKNYAGDFSKTGK